MYGLLEYVIMESTENAEIYTLKKAGPWPKTEEKH
jgi:hypothetical protein